MHKTMAAVFITTALLIPGLAHRADAGASAAWPPSVVDANPAPNLVVGSTYPQISARFSALTSVNPTSIRIAVDDRDVTSAATVTNAYVSYVPVTPMNSGRHTVTIVGQALDGTPFSDTWGFMVNAGGVANNNFLYAPGPFGYPGFGFFPPGFSLFVPGPIFIVAGNFVQVIFFSPFSPFGTGFVTIGGIPGQFFLTPWFGCPGFYWARVPVPFGVMERNAILSAHFTNSAGQTVIVHSTTPLQIDGTRTTLPSTIHFANQPVFVSHPKSPQDMVQFVRVVPRAGMSVVPGVGANNRNGDMVEPVFVAPKVVVPERSTKPITPVMPGAGGKSAGLNQITPADPVRIMESNHHSINPTLGTGRFSVTTVPYSTGNAPYSIGPYSMPIAPYLVPLAPSSSHVSPFAMPGIQIQSKRVHQGTAAQR